MNCKPFGMGFFACYLLTPVTPPQRLRCTYVGFTVSPTRRIRQHNGELVNGAKRTLKYRPWEMIVVVHGFPSKFHALQFEWAWQHPYNCRFTKARLLPLKGTKGIGQPRSVKRKLIELHEMLHVAPWTAFPLTIVYTNKVIQDLVQPTIFFQWPVHMKCKVCPLHEIVQHEPHTLQDGDEDADRQHCHSQERVCYICDEPLSRSGLQVLQCYHTGCKSHSHALCLADHFLLEVSLFSENGQSENADSQALRPEKGTCPNCAGELLWPLLVKGATSSTNVPKTVTKAKKNATKKRRRIHTITRNEESSALVDQVCCRDDYVGDAQVDINELPTEMDANDSDNTRWFEEDYSVPEFWDSAENGDGANDASVPTPHMDTSPSQRLRVEEWSPIIVDLTADDD